MYVGVVNFEIPRKIKMDCLTGHVHDASVLRRMLFASKFLPKEYPGYLETVSSFSVHNTSHSPLDPTIVGELGNL